MSDARRKRHPGALKTRNDNGENAHRSQTGSQTHGHRGRNNNSNVAGFRDGQGHRMTTSDKVKRIVQEEGRTARNLVIYHVPVQEHGQDRSRPRQVRKKDVKDTTTEGRLSQKSLTELTKSPKSDGGKKPDLRARYWKFLFDNLQRAVDAIYETCEQDESALECKEVIMMLRQSTRDFQSLIDRLHVQKEFEIATKDGDRPFPIAWEVRKMSPGKSPSGLGHHGHTSPSPAQRVLNFSYPTTATVKPEAARTGNSWADRVKGITPTPESSREGTPKKDELHPVLPEPPVLSPVPSSLTESVDSFREINDSDLEAEGWETVHRGGKSKPWGSPSQRSLENLYTPVSDHHKLTRSISDPNTNGQKFHRRSKNNRLVSKLGNNRKSVTSSTEDVVDSQSRPRTNSKDSEKENRPSPAGSASQLHGQTVRAAAGSDQTNAKIDSTTHLTPSAVKVKSQKSPNMAKKFSDKVSSGGSSSSGGGGGIKSGAGAVIPRSVVKTKDVGSAAKMGVGKPSMAAVVGAKAGVKGKAPAVDTPDIGGGKAGVKGKASPVETPDVGGAKGKAPAVKLNTLDIVGEKAGVKGKAPAVDTSDVGGVNGKALPTDTPDIAEVGTKLSNDISIESTESPRTSTDLEADSGDQDDDASVKQLDDALASVIDEENSLTVQLEKECDQALESAILEEESWLKELALEENTDIDMETEGSDLGNTTSSFETSTPGALDWDSMVAEYDAQEESGEKKSWGEMVEEADTRTPGHAVHMHEKLSSPSRKRSPTESKKRHEEKQAKAQELRDKLMLEKSERLREIGKKVEEVRSWKEELMRQKRETIERKMQQAEEKRQTMLKSKAQKAHDEEAKANEIAFINSLEAQNKRLDIMSKQKESEARLQDIQDERQRRHEEKLAKEAAVEERRKTLQAERLARLKDIQARRKIKDARIEQHLLDKETERQEAFRAKEKDREERLAALNAQHEQHIQDLQKKIQQKQDETSQRHQETLKQIREKAFEMSVLRHSTEDHNEAPELTPYDNKKMCTICNALIPSEVYLLSHLRGKTHQQALKHNNNGMSMSKQEIENFNLKHIVNVPDNNTHPKIVSEKERIKSLKKRCKKLKQRMNSRGLEFENSIQGKQAMADSENKAKMQKVIRDINKYLQSQESGPWAQNRVTALDRALGELNRIFDKKVFADQISFRHLGGLTTLCRIVQLVDTTNIQIPPPIPQKTLVLACQVFKQACKGCYDNCHYMMFSNKIGLLIEFSIHQLMLMLPGDLTACAGAGSGTSEPPKLPHNLLAISLLQLLSIFLTCLAKNSPATKSSEASLERMVNTVDAFNNRGNDIISYIISVGIVDKLTQYLRLVQGSIDNDRDAADVIQHSLALLVAITKFMSKRKSYIFDKKKLEDPTQLLSTFEVTELVGIVSLLYGMLLHSGTRNRGDAAPEEFPQHTLNVATTGLRMLNHMATLDLDMLQCTLGQEGMSLEFRHITSYLVWYCSHHNAEELLHEVILCVGYFTVGHLDNQVVIQSGQPPTVLQQLCALPFQYFSDPRLVNVLFPTLIACCYSNQENKEILEQELSCALLSNFIEEKQLEAQQLQQQQQSASSKKSSDKEKRENKDGEARMTLATRFPVEQWTAAQEYFKVA